MASETQDSILDIVSAEKETLLNSGDVADSEDKSRSTLSEKESAAGIRRASSPKSRKGVRMTPTLKEKGESANTQVSEPSSKLKDKTYRAQISNESKKEVSLSAIAFDKVADEIDESPELEGAGRASKDARSAKRIISAMRKRGAADGSAASVKAKGAHKAKKGALSKSTFDAKAAAGHKAAGARMAEAATAANKASGIKAMLAAASGTLAPLGGILLGILAFVLGVLIISQIISAIFGFWENEEAKRSLEGLPPYITYEMVEEAIKCQEEYGHPAGCTLAQIVAESGQGDHMSQLATRDHNLFGMKWAASFASAPEVTGKAAWVTGEEYDGAHVTITAFFTVFKGDVECIRFRSRVFLQSSNYANNALIKEAISEKSSDKMAEGLKAAGWATSSSYVESLKTILDTYNLRRFDGMSLEDFHASEANGSAVVAAAFSQLGVPYVWGGTTPNVGLDCSGLTQYCYKQAGISIPRTADDQAAFGTKVPVSQARAGDILWRYGHVAIYIGDDKYIHEPQSGDVCKISQGISSFTAAIQIR